MTSTLCLAYGLTDQLGTINGEERCSTNDEMVQPLSLNPKEPPQVLIITWFEGYYPNNIR